MSRVEELKAATELLSPRERCELNALLQSWTEDEWDREMAADAAPGGKLRALKLAVEKEAKAGRLQDFQKTANP